MSLSISNYADSGGSRENGCVLLKNVLVSQAIVTMRQKTVRAIQPLVSKASTIGQGPSAIVRIAAKSVKRSPTIVRQPRHGFRDQEDGLFGRKHALQRLGMFPNSRQIENASTAGAIIPVFFSCFPALLLGASKRRLIGVAPRGVKEILESVEPSSPNPRRNASKRFEKSLGRGNKPEMRSLFISCSFPLYFRLPWFAGQKWKYTGNTFPL